MNTFMASGICVTEPEMKVSKRTGRQFCVFRLMVLGEYCGSDGEREKDFFSVLAFGKTAQAIHAHLAKRAHIEIRGSLKNYDRLDALGNKRQETCVMLKQYEIHDWLKKEHPIEDLRNGDGELVIPKEITDSMIKEIRATDEDIPYEYSERSLDDLLSSRR